MQCAGFLVSLVSGNTYWRGRLSTVNLLVLTTLGQVLLTLQNVMYVFIKCLNEEVNCAESFPSVSLPCLVSYGCKACGLIGLMGQCYNDMNDTREHYLKGKAQYNRPPL